MPQVRVYASNAERQRAHRARVKAARQAGRIAKGLPPAPEVTGLPSTARWAALIEVARSAIETARGEMQAYYDDRSEAWQAGERAEAMRERIHALDGLLSDIEALQ